MKNSKLLILLSFLFLCSVSKAQTANPIVGKWKVFSMKSKELYVNFKTDSVALTGDFDAEKKEMAKGIATMAAQQFANYLYHFTKDGKMVTRMNNVVDDEGTYTIDPPKKLIDANIKRRGHPVKERIKYSFRNKVLVLEVVDAKDPDPIRLELERVPDAS